jgi:deoxyribonuclease V
MTGVKLRALHPWDLSPSEAIALQRRLCDRVESHDRLGELRRVAGVDVGMPRGSSVARAAVAVLSWPELELVEHVVVESPIRFPYVPGLLSFREIPAVALALERLQSRPDLILCDGQGRAHPRRFGLACHLGLLTDTPTLGAAKSRLIGTYAEPGLRRGASTRLLDGSEVIGRVVRTRTGVRPLFVSVGHGITLDRAVELTLRAASRTRLPETTRWAHRLASG